MTPEKIDVWLLLHLRAGNSGTLADLAYDCWEDHRDEAARPAEIEAAIRRLAERGLVVRDGDRYFLKRKAER